MNAINLYIQTCRYVMQAQANDSTSWEDLYQYLPYLRQALSCCVCSNIIQCPMGPINSKCQHHVCRECRGGKMRLRSSCSWCKNWQEYVENNQLRLIVQCFKKLCDYLASSVIAQHLRNNNSSTSDSNSLLSIITEGRTVTDDYSFNPSGPSALPCLLPSKISATSNGTSLLPVKQELVGVISDSAGGTSNQQLHDLGYSATAASIKKEDCDDATSTDSTSHTTPSVPDNTQPNQALLSPVPEIEEPAKVTSTSSPEPPVNIADNIVTSSSAGVVVLNNDARCQQQSSVDSDVAGVDHEEEEEEDEENQEEEEEEEDDDEEEYNPLGFGPLMIAEQNGVVFPQAEQPEELEEEDDEETQGSEVLVISPHVEHIGHLEHSQNLANTVSAVDISGGVSISGVVSVSADINISGGGDGSGSGCSSSSGGDEGGGGDVQALSCSSSEAVSSGPNSPLYDSYSFGDHTAASTSEHDYNNKDTYTGIYSVSMSNDHAPKLKIRRTSYSLGSDHHHQHRHQHHHQHRDAEPSPHHNHHQQHRSAGTVGSTLGHKQKSRSKPPRQKAKPKGCRCGMATPTPGKLTCCGQRCPCYSAFKGCLLECRCRGCRNPRKVHGSGDELPKFTISREKEEVVVVQEEESGEESGEETDGEDSDIEVDL